MDVLKCSVCETELKSSMEIEYARFINEFFCSTKCATDRYFGYMESTCVDLESPLPEGVEINDAGVLVRAVEHSVQRTGDLWGTLGKCSICGKSWQECNCLTRR